MRHLTFFICSAIVIINACSTSPGSTAIGFLWNDQPEPTSTRLMVVSDLTGEELRSETIRKMEALGFIVEDFNETLIVSEPKDVEGNQMMISVELDDNAIILSAEVGPIDATDDEGWKPVVRGPGDQGSFEWNLLEVLANSIDHISIRYND